jgi:imidazolonepropionase-like amidohydrolase
MILFLLFSCTLPLIAQTVAFENVNVVPMDRNRVLQRRTVIVRDGRIDTIGPAGRTQAPSGAVRIDGTGKYLMPGLAEMHGHLPPPGTSRDVVENILFLYVANGVTTVRGMLGNAGHLELRREIDEGKVLGPKLYVAGPALSGTSAPDAATAQKMVREQKAAGFDHIKIQEGLKSEVYDAIVAAAREAGLSIAGHVPNEVGVHRAIEAKQKSIDHLDNYIDAVGADESKIAPLARTTRDAGVWMVPTMALWEVFNGTDTVESLRQRPEVRYMPLQMVDQWAAAKQKMLAGANPQTGARSLEFRRKMLRALHRAGARIALGTDSPQVFSVPGFSIHREMVIMTACGMTPYDVMRSGTLHVARYFGTEQQTGTVETGKRADLILLEANPLTDVGNVARRAGVMVRGRWLPETEIQARLQKIASGAQ